MTKKPTYKELEQKITELKKEHTERKRAEEALRKSEQQKSAILDSMKELVVYQDTNHTVLWANQAAGESVGVAPERLVGHFCYEIWAKRHTPCEGCSIIIARETGHAQEAEITTPDGRVWLTHGYPIRDANGIIVGAVETTLEITDRKRLEDTLKRSEERYRSILEGIDEAYFEVELTGTLTFFNNSLCKISGYTRDELFGMNNREYTTPETAK